MEDKLVEILRMAGLKATPQRIAILRKLYMLKNEHPSLNKLYTLVKSEIPTLSFSTLFTTIKRLEEKGLVKLFDLNGETRIEVNVEKHVNVVLHGENRVLDVVDKELIKQIAGKLGVSVDDIYLVNVIIRGDRMRK